MGDWGEEAGGEGGEAGSADYGYGDWVCGVISEGYFEGKVGGGGCLPVYVVGRSSILVVDRVVRS